MLEQNLAVVDKEVEAAKADKIMVKGDTVTMAKLQNAAFEIFVKEYEVENRATYAKFEDVVYHIDTLGKDLLLNECQGGLSTEEVRLEMLETNIENVLSALSSLAKHCNLDIRKIMKKAAKN